MTLNDGASGVSLTAFDHVVGVGVDLKGEVPAVLVFNDANLVEKKLG